MTKGDVSGRGHVKYNELGKGFIRKREKREVGLFIDGTGLDRATRRINKKVDMAALVRGVTSGVPPLVARYYTLVPYEDDSRQRAFLDAVARAGLTVIVKRLPPKGITRQVSVDLEMATDIAAFALGLSTFSKENEYLPTDHVQRTPVTRKSTMPFGGKRAAEEAAHETASGAAAHHEEHGAETAPAAGEEQQTTLQTAAKRAIVVVCPSRELAYPITLSKQAGVDSTTADFGQFNQGDILKSASKWIDLSDSETIWRE